MLLLLGKNDAVEKYAECNLKVNIENDIMYYPDIKTHYSEFGKCIDIIKEKEPSVITTQNQEMINILLDSDLDFNVITVWIFENELLTRKADKEQAKYIKNRLGLDLRG